MGFIIAHRIPQSGYGAKRECENAGRRREVLRARKNSASGTGSRNELLQSPCRDYVTMRYLIPAHKPTVRKPLTEAIC